MPYDWHQHLSPYIWQKGLTAAILAAYSNQSEVLEVLIKAGADLSISMQVL